MEYITEVRGGWDEWSDEYAAVTGLRLPSGDQIDGHLIEDRFTDQDGNALQVELPMRDRIGETISVERYDPEYTYVELTCEELANRLEDETTIRLE